MTKGKEKDLSWQETRERGRERIKADRNAEGCIRVKFFCGNSVVLLTGRQYDEIADLYEKVVRVEKKLIELEKRIDIVRKQKPGFFAGSFWKRGELNEKNVEDFLMVKEETRYYKKYYNYVGEIEKKLNSFFSKLKVFPEEKTKFFKGFDAYEKKINEILEDYKKRGLIGDFENQNKNFSLSENSGDSDEEIGPEKAIETVLGAIEAVCFFAGWAIGKDLTGTGPLREEVSSSTHYKQTELIISPPPSPPKDW